MTIETQPGSAQSAAPARQQRSRLWLLGTTLIAFAVIVVGAGAGAESDARSPKRVRLDNKSSAKVVSRQRERLTLWRSAIEGARQAASATIAPPTTAAPTTTAPTTTAPAKTAPAATAPTTVKSAPPTTAGPATTRAAAPANAVNVSTYGAVANDSGDDTAAIQRAIDSVPADTTIVFDGGTFIQSNLIRVSKAGVRLWSSSGAVIHAVNPARQAIMLQGERTALEGLTLTTTATQRLGTLEDTRVALDHSKGSVVTNVHVNGSASAGIFAFGATDYLIANNIVENTKADGIHSTYGSMRGRVVNNMVRSVGDDCVAVVSYIPEGLVTDITIEGNTCLDGYARGITVVGGSRVKILNNRVERSRAAGIYLACEPAYNTYAAKQIDVIGNTIVNANWDPGIGHASILLFGRPGTWSGLTLQNEDILIMNNTSINPIGGGAHIVSVDSYSQRVNIIGNQLQGTQSAVSLNTLAAGGYNVSGNANNGAPVADHIGNAALLPK